MIDYRRQSSRSLQLEVSEDDTQGPSLRTTYVNGSAGRADHYSIGIVNGLFPVISMNVWSAQGLPVGRRHARATCNDISQRPVRREGRAFFPPPLTHCDHEYYDGNSPE